MVSRSNDAQEFASIAVLMERHAHRVFVSQCGKPVRIDKAAGQLSRREVLMVVHDLSHPHIHDDRHPLVLMSVELFVLPYKVGWKLFVLHAAHDSKGRSVHREVIEQRPLVGLPDAFEGSRAAQITLTTDTGEHPTVAVPPAALKLIGQVLGAMSERRSVSIIANDHELSTVEAANFLNVSRPFIIKEIEAGRLVAHESKVHAELLEGIRGACGERRRATVLSFTQQGLTALCSVLPLRATHVLSLCLTAAPQALLVWTKPRTLDDAEQLSAALGFSESEARLALVLVTGKTLKDFAKLQGCTMNTARTHLKNLLRKSGCSRQIELVQLLMPLQIC